MAINVLFVIDEVCLVDCVVLNNELNIQIIWMMVNGMKSVFFSLNSGSISLSIMNRSFPPPETTYPPRIASPSVPTVIRSIVIRPWMDLSVVSDNWWWAEYRSCPVIWPTIQRPLAITTFDREPVVWSITVFWSMLVKCSIAAHLILAVMVEFASRLGHDFDAIVRQRATAVLFVTSVIIRCPVSISNWIAWSQMKSFLNVWAWLISMAVAPSLPFPFFAVTGRDQKLSMSPRSGITMNWKVTCQVVINYRMLSILKRSTIVLHCLKCLPWSIVLTCVNSTLNTHVSILVYSIIPMPRWAGGSVGRINRWTIGVVVKWERANVPVAWTWPVPIRISSVIVIHKWPPNWRTPAFWPEKNICLCFAWNSVTQVRIERW